MGDIPGAGPRRKAATAVNHPATCPSFGPFVNCGRARHVRPKVTRPSEPAVITPEISLCCQAFPAAPAAPRDRRATRASPKSSVPCAILGSSNTSSTTWGRLDSSGAPVGRAWCGCGAVWVAGHGGTGISARSPGVDGSGSGSGPFGGFRNFLARGNGGVPACRRLASAAPAARTGRGRAMRGLWRGTPMDHQGPASRARPLQGLRGCRLRLAAGAPPSGVLLGVAGGGGLLHPSAARREEVTHGESVVSRG